MKYILLYGVNMIDKALEILKSNGYEAIKEFGEEIVITFNCDYEESLINEVKNLLNSNGIFYNFHMSTVMYPQGFFKSLTLMF